MYFNRRGTQPISLDEVSEEMKQIYRHIQDLLYKLGDECDNIRFDHDDLEQKFLRDQYFHMANRLEEFETRYTYLSKPVTDQGYIRHNESQRYELPSGYYFTSGDVCEILYSNDRTGEQYWRFTRIEHNGDDYYATAFGKNFSLDGMLVRVRG